MKFKNVLMFFLCFWQSAVLASKDFRDASASVSNTRLRTVCKKYNLKQVGSGWSKHNNFMLPDYCFDCNSEITPEEASKLLLQVYNFLSLDTIYYIKRRWPNNALTVPPVRVSISFAKCNGARIMDPYASLAYICRSQLYVDVWNPLQKQFHTKVQKEIEQPSDYTEWTQSARDSIRPQRDARDPTPHYRW